MHVCGEVPQLDLLTFACLDREGVRIDPFVGRNVRRVFGVSKNIEDSGIVDYREKGDRRYDLFENRSDLGLDFGFRLGGWTVWDVCSTIGGKRCERKNVRFGRVGRWFYDVDVKDPSFEWYPGIF